MSIKPPSDLLLDVARAADPATSAAAAERLARIAGVAGDKKTVDPAFATVLSKVQDTQVAAAPAAPIEPAEPVAPVAQTEVTTPQLHPRFWVPPADADKKAYEGLEALLLQNVVETMLPESSEFYGEGSAGAIWRSMLAEELGTDLAKKIDLGLMPRYLRNGHHPAKHELASSPTADTVANTIRTMVPKLS